LWQFIIIQNMNKLFIVAILIIFSSCAPSKTKQPCTYRVWQIGHDTLYYIGTIPCDIDKN